MQFTLPLNQVLLIVLWYLGAVFTNDNYFVLKFDVFFRNK